MNLHMGGTPYRRCTWNVHGKKQIVWRCISRLDHGSKYCKSSPTIHEEPLHRAIVQAVNEFYDCGDDVAKILKANVESVLAREQTDMIPEKVTPHTFRHTKAMHLCQAGIDMIHIRDILGHTRITATEIYAKINVEQMRDALERAYPELNPKVTEDWNDDSSLMEFLNSL